MVLKVLAMITIWLQRLKFCHSSGVYHANICFRGVANCDSWTHMKSYLLHLLSLLRLRGPHFSRFRGLIFLAASTVPPVLSMRCWRLVSKFSPVTPYFSEPKRSFWSRHEVFLWSKSRGQVVLNLDSAVVRWFRPQRILLTEVVCGILFHKRVGAGYEKFWNLRWSNKMFCT